MEIHGPLRPEKTQQIEKKSKTSRFERTYKCSVIRIFYDMIKQRQQRTHWKLICNIILTFPQLVRQDGNLKKKETSFRTTVEVLKCCIYNTVFAVVVSFSVFVCFVFFIERFFASDFLWLMYPRKSSSKPTWLKLEIHMLYMSPPYLIYRSQYTWKFLSLIF